MLRAAQAAAPALAQSDVLRAYVYGDCATDDARLKTSIEILVDANQLPRTLDSISERFASMRTAPIVLLTQAGGCGKTDPTRSQCTRSREWWTCTPGMATRHCGPMSTCL